MHVSVCVCGCVNMHQYVCEHVNIIFLCVFV